MRDTMGALVACAMLLSIGTARAADDASRVNVAVITVDTMRADHVGAYGHHSDTTPTLDRLAANVVRFADVTVQWPQTWPSIASMMTSTYPSATGVRYSPRRPLARSHTTLAEMLAATSGSTKKTLIVVTADHGEGLGEQQAKAAAPKRRKLDPATKEAMRSLGYGG